MVSAIVLAGGSGSRMNSSTAKQCIELCGMPVVAHALKAFQQSEVVDEIVLVTRLEDVEYAKKELVQRFGLTNGLTPFGRAFWRRELNAGMLFRQTWTVLRMGQLRTLS